MGKYMRLGKLTKVNPKSVWSNENEFNEWLAENIDQLAEILGIELEVLEVESEIGSFRADIVARDLSGEDKLVVIESQLGKTDHEHLGKIITYSAGKNASTVVWISPEFREEHISALDWLNSISSEISFFGIELQVLKINGSKPAVYFNIVSKPDNWRRERTRTPLTGRALLYQQFFQELAEKLYSEGLAKTRKGLPQNWLSIGAGKSGFWYSAVFTRDNRYRIELVIDTGNYDRNKKIFNKLKEYKEEIEKNIGFQLNWNKLENSRCSRIELYYHEPIRIEEVIEDENKKKELINWTINIIKKFKKTFTPKIKTIEI